MRNRKGYSFTLSFVVASLCWTHIGLCQEHFLSEVALKEGRDLVRNNGVPDSGHITIMGLKLGVHTIEDARKKLGEAKAIEPGHHFDPYVCYRSAIENDNTVLTLSFNDHGSMHYLTRIQIIAASEKFKARDSCSKSSLVSKNLSMQSGIRLGATPTQAKKIWAIATRERGVYLLATSDYYNEMGDRDRATCNDMTWVAIARFASTGLAWLEVIEMGEMIRQGHCTSKELEQIR